MFCSFKFPPFNKKGIWTKKKKKKSTQLGRLSRWPCVVRMRVCVCLKFSRGCMTTHTPNRTNAHSKTLRCFWQMRELSHLLTCGGVEERSRSGALSTSLSRRWIACAKAIHHRGGVGVWLVAQSPCYPLKYKSERHRSWTCSLFQRIQLSIPQTSHLV